MSLLRAIAVPALLLGATGCGFASAPNELGGSLTDIFDMSFDSTRVRLYESEISVEYVDSQRLGMVALRVTVDNDGALDNGVEYDLGAVGTVGISDEYGSQLPAFEEGSMTLRRYDGEADGVAKGEFGAVFVTQDGLRLTVFGNFDADLEVVDAF